MAPRRGSQEDLRNVRNSIENDDPNDGGSQGGQEDEIEGEFEDDDEEPGEGAPVDAGTQQAAGESEHLDDDEQQPPARQPSRGDRRFQVLNDRLRDRERELEDLRRDRQPARQQQTGPQEESEEAFQARLVNLPPDERSDAKLARMERRYAFSAHQVQLQVVDGSDRAAFEARKAYDKRYLKYADEVERRHAALLRGENGLPPQLIPRETILKVIIGERVLGSGGSKEQHRQQQRGRQRIERNTTRAQNMRGDAGSGRQDDRSRRGTDNERQARAKRLENIEL